MKNIYFITSNKAKFEEAKSILPNLVQLDIDLPELQETNPKKIIKEKLILAFKHKKGQFVVEDTGLYIDSLGGLPGPLVKWFLKTIGNKGLYKIAKLFGTKASAITYIGYARSIKDIRFFKGEVKGKIVKPRGAQGFGWDPIFLPNGYKKTFAQMTLSEKNKISMRRLAFGKLSECEPDLGP